MRANGSPLASLPAGAKIFDVNGILDGKTGTITGGAFLDDAAKEGWFPAGAEDFIPLPGEAGLLDDVPAGDTTK